MPYMDDLRSVAVFCWLGETKVIIEVGFNPTDVIYCLLGEALWLV